MEVWSVVEGTHSVSKIGMHVAAAIYPDYIFGSAIECVPAVLNVTIELCKEACGSSFRSASLDLCLLA